MFSFGTLDIRKENAMDSVKKWCLKLVNETYLGKQQGAALVVTLLVMMVLVLLALSLILQSQTEYTIAINEQDAFTALGHGEATLELLNKAVRNYATSIANPTDLDDFLNGPDNADTTDDNLPDLSPGRTLDLLVASVDDLVFANETNTSVIMSKDFGDGLGAQTY